MLPLFSASLRKWAWKVPPCAILSLVLCWWTLVKGDRGGFYHCLSMKYVPTWRASYSLSPVVLPAAQGRGSIALPIVQTSHLRLPLDMCHARVVEQRSTLSPVWFRRRPLHHAPRLLLGWLLGTESFLSIIYCVYSFSSLLIGWQLLISVHDCALGLQ